MKVVALTMMCLMTLAGGLLAQIDQFGAMDTVYLDNVTPPAGQECTVSVNVWNDEMLGAVTVPLTYPKAKLEFVKADFAGGRLEYIGTKPVTVDTAQGTILVGAIVIFEQYIQPGNGPMFKLTFRLKDDLTPGEVMMIDSVRIGPANLLLTPSTGLNSVYPVFHAGRVTVAQLNRPPYFSPLPDQYVAEGESLVVEIKATDPEGNSIVLANPVHPHTASFVDNGNGTARFVWQPDFVGPLSAGMSPFEFVFRASDGQASSHIPVKVNVINVNRPPAISAPGQINGEAGDSLGIEVSNVDSDFEPVQWSISGLPPAASFDFGNPGLITWASNLSDSGHNVIRLIATDPHGLADTAQVRISLAPVVMYSLRIDTVESFSGRVVDLSVYLKNREAVKEFDLLISFDAAIMTPLGVDFSDGRCSHFDYLDYRLNYNGTAGDVRINGKADIAGEPTIPPIAVGEGLLCRMSVQVSSNLIYVGNQVPTRFVFRTSSNNRLILSDGTVISKPQISFFDGYILIKSPGTTRLGDININGVAFEISDAVYFSNFFISPTKFPLNEQQVLNSDINRDGMAPSVADLVLMINIIAGEVPPPEFKPLPPGTSAGVALVRDRTGLYIRTNAPVELGGALFRLTGRDIEKISTVNLTNMDLKENAGDGELAVLLISFDRQSISSGETSVIRLSDNPDLDVRLAFADLADTEGRVLSIDKIEEAALPRNFALYQNVPNPFNPSTEIQFDLDAQARVTLSVFNILGQEVIRLVDAEFAAGSHTVVWDGLDRNGRPAASGMYFYRITAGANAASRKMILMK